MSVTTTTTGNGNGTRNRIKGIGGNGRNGNGNGKAGGKNGNSGNGHPGNGDAGQMSAAEVELVTQQWEAKREIGKSAYAEADRLMERLIASMGAGGSVVLTDGRTVKVKDNFVDSNGQPRNVAYKPCGVKRFEIAVK